jgi:RNA polymerase sigma-70 factor (ECF subfamily)
MRVEAPLQTAAVWNKCEFTSVYEHWFGEVSRWVRAFGGPDADVEDLTQEVFVVVQRRLDSFDGENLAGWLYRITQRTVRDHRRKAWFRNLFSRTRDIELESLPGPYDDPARLFEKKDAARVVHILAKDMNEEQRSALLLFEVAGYSGEEIAALEGVPVATVWTRVHRGRKSFSKKLDAFRKKEDKPWLRPAVALALLFVLLATASAMWAHVRRKRSAPAATVTAPVRSTKIDVSPPSPPIAVAAKPATAAPHARRSPAPDVATPTAATPSPPAAAQPQASDGTALVVAASRALRRDGDPARAAVLLSDYLEKFPDGNLAEEASALAIEAALAQSDDEAESLAARYLARYPNGRFSTSARAALKKTGR